MATWSHYSARESMRRDKGSICERNTYGEHNKEEHMEEEHRTSHTEDERMDTRVGTKEDMDK